MLQTVIFDDPASLKQLGFEDRDEANVISHLLDSINEATSISNNESAFAELKKRVESLHIGLRRLFNNCLGLKENKHTFIEWIRAIPEITTSYYTARQYQNFIAFICTTRSIELDINYKDENGQGVIQALFEKKTYCTNDYLVYFLQRGYQIDRKDRETMRDNCERETYKMYATLSRLASNLYRQERTDLIAELLHSTDHFVKLIYIIESFLFDKPEYFGYTTNVWLCIANNAITNYQDYWIFIEAALRKSGKWEEVYRENSFQTKYNTIDQKAILQWKSQIQYEILCRLYPQLEVPAIQIERQQKVITPYEYANSLFEESELTKILKSLSINIEGQRPVWGYKHIEGETAKEKVHSLWNNLSHETFFDALLYLSDTKASYTILYLLEEYAETDLRHTLYNNPEIQFKIQRGLEAGKISNLDFRLLLWKLGYRHNTIQGWRERGTKTSSEQVALYCMDRLCNDDSIGDLKEIMSSDIIRTICLIEAIKNNHLFFTEKSWKSYINSTRGASQNHPLYKYWGYIDIALDSFRMGNGKSMREYLLQKEPGIRLEKSNATIEVDSDLYRALSVLYPEIFSTF